MASPVNYNYEPNDNVYVINSCVGNPYVTSGVIVRVRIQVLVTETMIRYDVRLSGNNGTREFAEEDLFVDKPTAMAEYENRVS